MPFDFQPVLTGELIELRPMRLSDFRDLYLVASDPLIWEQHPARDRYKEEVFAEFFREGLSAGGAFVASDRASDLMIGSSRYHGYDEEKSEIEIGWTFLARSHWGGAFNGEMKRMMLDHAFQFVESVIFVIGQHNLRSQHAVQKIGAVRDGSKVDAKGVENYVFRIHRDAHV